MEEKILDILEDICEDDIVREELDINLFESGLMDSLGLVELLVQIEENYNIIISPSEIERDDIETPNKIISLIKQRSWYFAESKSFYSSLLVNGYNYCRIS